MVLKTGVSVCLRPNPLPETTRTVTMHGEGSFGFPAVTETTGRRLPSEASPSGGAGDKNKEKVQSGSRRTWCKKLPVAGSVAEGRAWRTNGQLPRRVPVHPGQDRPAKEGAMTRAGLPTQGPRAPRGLLSHCTLEPSFWTLSLGPEHQVRATAAFCPGSVSTAVGLHWARLCGTVTGRVSDIWRPVSRRGCLG